MIWLETSVLYTIIIMVGIPIGIWLGEHGRDPGGGQYTPQNDPTPDRPKVGV